MEELVKKNGVKLLCLEIDVGNSGHITNMYIVEDIQSKEVILIDPADNASKIIQLLEQNKLIPKYIAITHAHADHIAGLDNLIKWCELQKYNTKILIHENDKDDLIEDKMTYAKMLGLENINMDLSRVISLKDGQIIKFGNIKIEVIHTPGHTDGSIILYDIITNSLITGDTIFSDCYGRVDLETGSIDDMKNSINKIFARFDAINIYPGHGKITNLKNAKRRIKLLLAIRK